MQKAEIVRALLQLGSSNLLVCIPDAWNACVHMLVVIGVSFAVLATGLAGENLNPLHSPT